MPLPLYDRSHWPLFRVTMPKAGLDDRELEQHLQTVERAFLDGQRFALLIDARGAKPLLPKQRILLGRMLQRCFQRDPHVLAGLAVVLTSAIERGVLTAITWAAGRTYPLRTFETPEAAVSWLQAALKG
jgi:hypothetical protein